MKKSEKKFLVYLMILSTIMTIGMYTTYQREEEIVSNINTIGKILMLYRKYVPDYMASRQASVIRSEMFHEHVKQKLDQLRLNLDKSSNEVLDYAKKSPRYEMILSLV